MKIIDGSEFEKRRKALKLEVLRANLELYLLEHLDEIQQQADDADETAIAVIKAIDNYLEQKNTENMTEFIKSLIAYLS